MQRPARRCGFCLEQATGRSLTPPVPEINPPSTRANRENVAYMRAGTVRPRNPGNRSAGGQGTLPDFTGLAAAD